MSTAGKHRPPGPRTRPWHIFANSQVPREGGQVARTRQEKTESTKEGKPPESSGLLENSYSSSFNTCSPPRSRCTIGRGRPARPYPGYRNAAADLPPPLSRRPNVPATSRISRSPVGARKRTSLSLTLPPGSAAAPEVPGSPHPLAGCTGGKAVSDEGSSRGQAPRHFQTDKSL